MISKMKSVASESDRNRTKSLFIAFVAYATTLGGFLSRLPDLQIALGATNFEFGLVLLGIPVGIIVGSVFLTRLIPQIGAKRASIAFTIMFSACPLLTGLAGSAFSAATSLAIQGAALALANVSVNVLAHQMEKSQGRPLLNKCHGVWSISLLAASLIGAALVAMEIDFRVQFGCTFLALTAVLSAAYSRNRWEPDAENYAGPPSMILPTRAVLYILAYASATVIVEGITRNWGIIYLRDIINAPGELAALALPLVILSQALGRLASDPLIKRYGKATVAVGMILIGASGCAIVAVSTNVWIALLGILLIGFGVSTAHPQSVSAAASIGDRSPAENVASFSTVQTLLVYCGPPLFGFLSQGIGLRWALLAMVPFLLVTIFFVPAVAMRRSH
ncbi:MFS transporter [Agrobacterium sp. LAD9]|uniref:MFS transporter n=1 Tax=Agrobacterium sp. LAD9 TaxID=2055153 RepID=UPI001FCECF54|nr:MFS transporter [Agrobacterium sp. LAD9]